MYGMKGKKSKVMVNSVNNISADIAMNDQQLEVVTAVKYLGSTLNKGGKATADISIRLAVAMTAMRDKKQRQELPYHVEAI